MSKLPCLRKVADSPKAVNPGPEPDQAGGGQSDWKLETHAFDQVRVVLRDGTTRRLYFDVTELLSAARAVRGE